MNIHRLRDNIQDLEIALKMITRVRAIERGLVGNQYSVATKEQSKTLDNAQKLILTVLADFYMFRGKREGDEEE
jgi:hypothetical protein